MPVHLGWSKWCTVLDNSSNGSHSIFISEPGQKQGDRKESLSWMSFLKKPPAAAPFYPNRIAKIDL